MSNELSRKEIYDVKDILNELIPLTEEAMGKFRSARNWGFFDILGGGFLTNLIKHSKIGSARDIMARINTLLGALQRELKDIVIPTDFNMDSASFATFADFVFDGFLADVYMQSKIMSSLNQVEELHRRLLILDDKMNQLLARC